MLSLLLAAPLANSGNANTGNAFTNAFADHARLGYVDLRLPLPRASHINANAGADYLRSIVGNRTRGYVVTKGSEIVADYYMEPAMEKIDVQNVFSVTKTFLATLVGIAINDGLTTLDQSFEDIFEPFLGSYPNGCGTKGCWSHLDDPAVIKAMTVRQMLSFSGGFLSIPGACTQFDAGTAQNNLTATLNWPGTSASKVGDLEYQCNGAANSWMLYAITGKTPIQYAREKLFPMLGITRQVDWLPEYGTELINEGGKGLELTPLEFAKLGMLYKQKGIPYPGAEPLISRHFVDQSAANQLTQALQDDQPYEAGACSNIRPYYAGYTWNQWLYAAPGAGLKNNFVQCAIGHNGQLICIWPHIDVMLTTTKNHPNPPSVWPHDYKQSCDLLEAITFGLEDAPLNFDTPAASPLDTKMLVIIILAAVLGLLLLGICVGGTMQAMKKKTKAATTTPKA